MRIFISLVAFCSVLVPSISTLAQPVSGAPARLASDAARARDLSGLLSLLELWAQVNGSSPAEMARSLDSIVASARRAETRALAEIFRAETAVRQGDLDDAEARYARLGFVREWMVLGPFDNEGRRGVSAQYAPEMRAEALSEQGLEGGGIDGVFEPGANYQGKARRVTWQPNASFLMGARAMHVEVDLSAQLRPRGSTCSYATTTVHFESRTQAALMFGASAAAKVWVDGELLIDDDLERPLFYDRHIRSFSAGAGEHRILVKLCETQNNAAFVLRLLDTNARPLPFEVDASSAAPASRISPSRARLVSPLDAFEEQPLSFARYLALTGGAASTETPVHELALRGAENLRGDAKYRALLFALSATRERTEQSRILSNLTTSIPGFESCDSLLCSEVRLEKARLISGGFSPARSLTLLDRVDESAARSVPSAPTAESAQWTALADASRRLRAEIFLNHELPRAALEITRELHARAPDSPSAARLHADTASAAHRADEAIENFERALELRFDDIGARRVLVADAVHRQDSAAALSQLQTLRTLSPTSQRTLRYAAGLYEAIGQNELALSTLTDARRAAPEDASTAAAHGAMLLRMNQRDAATAALRYALELRPQDLETRELLEQIEPEARQDEAYAAVDDVLLARRVESAPYASSTLQDLTVNTIFESGLGSSFRQVAFQIHDDEGARRHRTYAIPFEPDVQRLTVRSARVLRQDGQVFEAVDSFEQQLGEPWYRIYYDARARVLVFPDLEPGDVVDIQYRIDDTAPRNLFADYFGDLRLLASDSPSRHFEYVLIAPDSREFFFGVPPESAGLSHERTNVTRGNRAQRIDHFIAENIAPIADEPGAPGPTDTSPYLHVSTYENWESVGAWYWGLIQDQLRLDDNLRNVVRELTSGLSTDEEKVTAIHSWVLDRTRYVGLEFGIHGYKPYRVTEIVRRGFGDCKDKASLMFAMMREAGVDAHIVLTRTRRNGHIESEPASLAVFDHAIAYVPSLDLYLDGTAEHNGIRELPMMDQGATVLHVWPRENGQGAAELRQTPVLEAQANTYDKVLRVSLDESGRAELEAEISVRGGMAPFFRQHFEAEGTRQTRLERQLQASQPGLELGDFELSNLESRNDPVELEYTAEVARYAEQDGDVLRVPFTSRSPLTPQLAPLVRRTLPLELGERSVFREAVTMRAPRGLRVAGVPNDAVIESAFGVFRVSIGARSERSVEITSELVMNVSEVSPEDYEAFRSWTTQVDEALRARVVMLR